MAESLGTVPTERISGGSMTMVDTYTIGELLADLTDDGDTVELPDGTTFRLRLSPDDLTFSDMETPDGLGTVAWVDDRDGRGERPRDFTGNAEKLPIGRGDRVWWEPPRDVPRSHPSFRDMRTTVRDILEFGYTVVILEHCDGTDAYGRAIVRDVASLGGVEPSPTSDYLAEILADLALELGYDADDAYPVDDDETGDE
jgi:hypothetical protein